MGHTIVLADVTVGAADALRPNDSLVYCTRCGAYAAATWRGLLQQCEPGAHPGHLVQRRLLEAGKYPRCGAAFRDMRVSAPRPLEGDRLDDAHRRLGTLTLPAAAASTEPYRQGQAEHARLDRRSLGLAFGVEDEVVVADWARRLRAAKKQRVGEAQDAADAERWWSDPSSDEEF
jgi:hypothetical protein